MKQYTTRELQLSQSWLDELPIEVVKYGKVICTLYSSKDNAFADFQDRLDKAVAVFKQQRAEIETLREYIEQADKTIERMKKLKSFEVEEMPRTNKTGFGIDPADFLNKMANKSKSSESSESLGRCQVPFCKAEAVEVATYYYFEDELKSIPNRRLCKKHLDLSNNNTPVNRGETKIVPI